jgi:hypothetical protein
MSKYLSITANQRPSPIGSDENNRVVFSANFSAMAQAPVEKWEEEIIKVLNTAGLATLGTDTFVGPTATIPTGAGPYLSINDSGGTAPIETHDGITYERLSVQVLIRATNYFTARTRALAVWRALKAVRNQTVTA